MRALKFFFGAWGGFCIGLGLAAVCIAAQRGDELAEYEALQDSARNN